jgi:response regulator RpfG family c-di-GMP phosphodiesterase
MSIAHDHEQRTASQQQDVILRGTESIGRALGLSPRQAYHLAACGALKSIGKVGGRYWANRTKLIREISGGD